ncbi:substrate-binding periplasmic protein [Inhella gelatinilytica]|uniref:ABC transporter substrate-binding protein n=1 Tax=Inhella gelatinilytica TaxID=2795030 RepID=A0A931NEM4_9BURK|nr:ABC transporter substrate-binding protein [Inhella gelatinilytica]MBH9554312.1 ABC transporter substrate-binding protein [Inhella gelatinilytica]
MTRLCALLLLLMVPVAGARPLVLNTEDAAPYNMLVNGQVVGIGADKVKLMMERIKQPYKIELLPWRRAYEDALRAPHSCVFSTTRTPERENLFKWVGPIAFNEWVLFGRADAPLKLQQLDDAKPYLIGAYNGDVREHHLRARGFKVETVVADSLNPRKLVLGRIDLWVSGRYDGAILIDQGGWNGQIVPVLSFHRSELYLACNPQVADEVIDRLNVMLGVINRDGSASKIDARYAHWPK